MKLAACFSAILVGLALANPAFADEAADCKAGNGVLITGTVLTAPEFKPAKYKLNGVWPSHTHVSVKSDTDGKTLDAAIDNVFATGYVKNVRKVPAPLDAIKPGDRIELCGLPFPNGVHWVHSNCGEAPKEGQANGWVKVIGADGRPGPNVESSDKFCSIFKKAQPASNQ